MDKKLRRPLQLLTIVSCLFFFCDAAAAQAVNWTKFYAGAQVGYSWDNINISGNAPVAFVSFDDSSVIGGVQAGKNIIQQGIYVAGLVADFNWLEVGTSGSASQSSSSTIDTCGDDCFVTTTTNTQTRVNLDVLWKASIRAKAGVLVAPNILLYTTGGVAFAKLKADATQTTTAGAPPSTTTDSISQQSTLIGFVIGGGTEMMITPNIGLFSQVLYYQFGEKNFNLLSSDLDVRLNETVAEAGISFYFN